MASVIPILKRVLTSEHSLSTCLVLLSVAAGHHNVDSIITHSGVSERTVHHALNLLREADLVISKISRRGLGQGSAGQRVSAHRLTGEGGRYSVWLLTGRVMDKALPPTPAAAL